MSELADLRDEIRTTLMDVYKDNPLAGLKECSAFIAKDSGDELYMRSWEYLETRAKEGWLRNTLTRVRAKAKAAGYAYVPGGPGGEDVPF